MPKMKPGEATEAIRRIAAQSNLDVFPTEHALEQIEKRDILMGDLLYLLKSGNVYDEARQSTNPKFWKYKIQGTTPNSHGRQIAAVIIPDFKRTYIKVVTVMWVDGT